jgi:hypothetical protein
MVFMEKKFFVTIPNSKRKFAKSFEKSNIDFSDKRDIDKKTFKILR